MTDKEHKDFTQRASSLRIHYPDLFKFISEAYFKDGVIYALTKSKYADTNEIARLENNSNYAEQNVGAFNDVFYNGDSYEES